MGHNRASTVSDAYRRTSRTVERAVESRHTRLEFLDGFYTDTDVRTTVAVVLTPIVLTSELSLVSVRTLFVSTHIGHRWLVYPSHAVIFKGSLG